MSLQKTENNVKDWLPNDFVETNELKWFGEYFSGERFIVATWEGNTEEDQRLQHFVAKLQAESEEQRAAVAAGIPDYPRAQQIAAEYGLLLPSDLHRNWGGQNEIWLKSADRRWFYLLPDGGLYRWNGRDDSVGATVRGLQRLFRGPFLDGQFVAALGRNAKTEENGADDLATVNPYYNRPFLLTVPLIRQVRSGPQLVEELSQKGGAFYPVDTTSPEYKRIVARRKAMERLTGTLFASAIPPEFDWTPQSFLATLSPQDRAKLPEDVEETIAGVVERIIDKQFGGELARLTASADEEQTEVWYEVFDAIQVEPPPRRTALLITLTQFGQEHLPFVAGRGVLGGPVGRVYQLALEAGLQPPPPPIMAPPPFNHLVAEAPSIGPDLHVGGPPIDNVSIDEEGTITLVRLVGYCAALGLFLSYWCFRSIKVTIMIFFVGVVSAAASLGLVWWTGAGVDAVLMSMPALVYVLGLSSAIHIINYYREEVEFEGVAGAPERALLHGWGPCALASITTAIGLLSLYTSNIIPIRKFGLYSAIGVIATLMVLFAYLPAALEIFVPSFAAKRKKRRDKSRDDVQAGVGVLADRWESFGRWVVNHYRLVTVGCLALFVFSALGLPKIRTSVQLLKLFAADSRIIRDYAWLEDNYGKLVPMEVVLRVPPEMQLGKLEKTEIILAGDQDAKTNITDATIDTASPSVTVPTPHALTFLERLRAVEQIQKTISSAFGDEGQEVVGRAMSMASLTPDLPPPRPGFNVQTGGYFGKMQENEEALLQSDYLRIESEGPLRGSELWRISLRVGALSDVNYGLFVNQLRFAVSPVLEAYRFRETVRESLDDVQRRNPRVLIIGRSNPAAVGEEPILLANGKTPDANADPTKNQSIDQDAVFAATLNEVLRSDYGSLTWINPDNPAAQKGLQSDKFIETLKQLDLVILLKDGPGVDPQAFAAAAPRFLDARNIDYQRSSVEIVDDVPVVRDSGPLQVIYTGVIPVVYKAQNTLLASLIDSIGWAFVLIAAVMVVLLNPGAPVLGMLRPSALLLGLGAGMVAMIPNVFPVVLIFGAMGHWGTLVDIGTMMTASVAMGVAVDDTIHFLSWLRRGLDSGLDRHQALIQTYRRVGPAMTQTTIVGGLGLFVFALSTFTPTQRFGTLMLLLLAAALIGDLIFFPALLAGPLGRFFKARPRVAHAGSAPANSALVGGNSTSSERIEMEETRDDNLRDASSQETAPKPKMLREDSSHKRNPRS